MGYEANMKAEDGEGKRRRNRQKMAAVLAILSLNGLAYYGFQNLYKSSHQRGKELQSSKLEEQSIIAARLIEALDEIRHLRRDLRVASERLLRMQEKHLQHVADFETSSRTIADAQSVEARRVAFDALNRSIESDPYHLWMLHKRHSLPPELRAFVAPRKLPFGFNSVLRSDQMTASVGHACAANLDDVRSFMSYEVGKLCPDDDNLGQKLLLAGCEPLPRRRCLARGPRKPTQPLPFPACLWTLPHDGNVKWEAYDCKSFECLNGRAARKVSADCLDCFDLTGRESRRWIGRASRPPAVDYTVDQVVALMNGTLRIGLDIGGGSGSFAVRMRHRNVTIVTSTLNLNGPFNNVVAHRGVVPIFMTIGQRFPFWDNTLDIVHSMHVLSNWVPFQSLEFILYDIDRVLRPGGVLWLDHFFCAKSELDTKFAPLIRSIGYAELRWDVSKKLDRGPTKQEVYLSALLQKPLSVRK